MSLSRFHIVYKKLDQLIAEEYYDATEEIREELDAVAEIRETIEEYSEPNLVRFTST